MSLKHNKKRSTAIVYELLIRKISESLVEGRKDTAVIALGMLKKYFSPKTPIGQELEAIDILRKTRGVDKRYANRVLFEVAKAASSLDRRLIEVKKSNLIKEINYSFGQEFFSEYKLPEYRALASMQVFIESFGKRQTLLEGIERAKIEEALISYMCSPESIGTPVYDPDRNITAYSIALKKFEQKYNNVLSKKQKALMEAYVKGLFTSDFKKFKERAAEDKKHIYNALINARVLTECKTDKVLSERLAEATKRLAALSVSSNEQFFNEMMLFHDLCKEIESND